MITKLLQNSMWIITEKIIRMVAHLWITAWVARYLGVENYGHLAYFLAFYFIFEHIVDFGLNYNALHDFADKKNSKEKLFTSLLTISLISFLVSALLFYYIFTAQSETSIFPQFFTITASLLLFFRVHKILEAWFMSQSKVKKFTFISTTSFLFSSIVKIFLLYNNFDFIFIALSFLVEPIILFVGLFISFPKQALPKKIEFDSGVTIDLLKRSLPVFISSLAMILYMRIDQIMLKNILGEVDLAHYAISVKLTELWYFLPNAIMLSLFPHLISLKNSNEDNFLNALKTQFQIMLTLSLFLVAGAWIFSDFLVPLIFGKEYLPAAGYLKVLIICNIFVFWSMAQIPWNTAEKMMSFEMIKTIIGAGLNIILNLVLIKPYGVWGAVYATLISYIFTSFIFNLFHPKTRRIFILQLASLKLWELKKIIK